MSEQQVTDYFSELSLSIRKELLNRNMTQKELSELIKVNPQQFNRAIKGGMTPKDKAIRTEVRRILGIKDE